MKSGNIYNIEPNNSLSFYLWSKVYRSRLMAPGSWLMPQGLWLIANKNCREGTGLGGPRGEFCIGHEPGALRQEP